MERLGYYSLSMGAYFGPIPVALEPRIKVAVFASGGLRFNYAPEIQPANFAPLVKIPVLLVNGRNDFQAPIEAQLRLMEPTRWQNLRTRGRRAFAVSESFAASSCLYQ